MKHENIFPVKDLRGYDGQVNGRVYYTRNNEQLSRKYFQPTLNSFHSLVAAKEIQISIAYAWRNMSAPEKAAWNDNFNEYKLQFPNEAILLNTYTYYYMTQFYWFIKWNSILEHAPSILAAPYMYNIKFSINPLIENSLYVSIDFDEPLEIGSNICIWITRPQAGFQHANRLCEKKMICGMSADSMMTVTEENNTQQFIVDDVIYDVELFDYMYASVRVFSPDGLVWKEKTQAVQIQEENYMYSIGDLIRTIDFSGLLGSPTGFAQQWEQDETKRYLRAWEMDTQLVIPIDYLTGSIIKSLIISCMQVNALSTELNMYFQEGIPSAAGTIWTTKKQFTIDVPGSSVLIYPELSSIDYTILTGYSYRYLLDFQGNSEELQIYTIQETTSKRVY